ncbi:hypothetical protein ABIE24_002866 [Mycetocola sp. 2940]
MIAGSPDGEELKEATKVVKKAVNALKKIKQQR